MPTVVWVPLCRKHKTFKFVFTQEEKEGCCSSHAIDAFPAFQAQLNERQMCLISQAAGRCSETAGLGCGERLLRLAVVSTAVDLLWRAEHSGKAADRDSSCDSRCTRPLSLPHRAGVVCVWGRIHLLLCVCVCMSVRLQLSGSLCWSSCIRCAFTPLAQICISATPSLALYMWYMFDRG